MFYTFNQNNSGGSFDINDRVAHHVIIEANSAEQANDIAEGIGIYFDGCEKGYDCPCCGDRWYAAWKDDGKDTPMIYDEAPENYQDIFGKPNKPYAYVYYADGTVVGHYHKGE